MRDYQQINAIIREVEGSFPVNSLMYGDVPLWPLIRQDLARILFWEDAGRPDAAALSSSSPWTNAIQTIWRSSETYMFLKYKQLTKGAFLKAPSFFVFLISINNSLPKRKGNHYRAYKIQDEPGARTRKKGQHYTHGQSAQNRRFERVSTACLGVPSAVMQSKQVRCVSSGLVVGTMSVHALNEALYPRHTSLDRPVGLLRC